MIKAIADPKKIAKPIVPKLKPCQFPFKKEIPIISSPIMMPMIESMY